MTNTLTVTVTIKNQDGEIITINESERAVPYIKEIEEQGFRNAFHDLETAVLETRKEASETVVTSYLETMSLKKNRD
ncbi:MAG: hypothetical protein FWG36_02860 [Oscillospiraceae bacterium]|nr:hypothetical protein [Oscillospiraceae bacterium]